MKKSSFLAKLTIMTLLAFCLFGCERKTKEQLFQEGIEQKDNQNLKGAVVLFKSALEKDPNFFEARHQLGLVYFASGNYAQAEKELEKVLLQAPGNSKVLQHLADLYLAMDRVEEAISIAERLAKEQGETAENLALLGKTHFKKGDLKKAEDYLKKAFELDPDQLRVRNSLASIKANRGLLDEARSLLRETMTRYPKDVEAYYLLMQIEARAGNVDEALAEGQRILQIAPREIRAPYLMGILELSRGDVEAARQVADDLLKRQPQDPSVIRLYGLVLFAQEKYQEAVEQLQQALQRSADPAGRYFLGLAYYHLEQFELALNQFQAVLDTIPTHTQSRLMAGMTLHRQGRFEDSRHVIEKLLKIDPDNAHAHEVLGSVLIAQGDFDQGMSELDKAIELAPDLVQPRLKKGLFNLSQGHFGQAEAPLEEALRIAPDFMNSRLLLVVSYMKQQNFAQAIQRLREGLQGKPEDAVLHNYMAAAYWGQGKSEAAIAELKMAKELKPDYFAPYFNMAGFYLSKGDSGGAAAEYREILKTAPDNLRALLSLASIEEVRGDRKSAENLLDRARATGAVEGFLASAAYFRNKGQKDKTLEYLQEGLQRHPGHPALLELQGAELLKQGRNEEGLKVFRTLAEERPEIGIPLLIQGLIETGKQAEAEKIAQREVDYKPEEPAGYLLLGKIYQQGGDSIRQEKVLKNGLERVKNEIPLNIRLAELYAGQQKFGQAVTILEGLLRRHPDNVSAIFLLASLHDQIGDKRKAKELYQEVIGKKADHIPALNNLAYLFADNYGNLDEALRLAAQAFQLNPGDPGIMDTLGYVLLRLGRHAEALPYLKNAVAKLPEQPDVLLHLAQAYSGAGKTDQAEEALQQVVSMPYPVQAEQAKKMLKDLHNHGKGVAL
ncbi:MAG: PEP-CTERM system TPR-repeat protein PrsT [Syntrophotaleaceae bacterium]